MSEARWGSPRRGAPPSRQAGGQAGVGTGEHLTPAEQHLGDRLAAFVDGELHDDARERVLAHLATCPGCKTAANDQRQLKNAVAAAAPPALSAGLLARLQGLPGGDGSDDSGPFGGEGGGVIEAASLGGSRLSGNVFGKRREDFSLIGDVASAPSRSGFRIHEVERQGNASRGRRFAFAAAGAFSMAAIAIGGALPLESVAEGGADEPGAAVTPLAVQATDAADLQGGRGSQVLGEELVGSVSTLSASAGSSSARSSSAPTFSPSAGTSPASVARPLMLPSSAPTSLDSPLPIAGSASATP